LSPLLLSFQFLRQLAFKPPLFSGLQKKGVLLYILNNAFLLDLAFETTKSALNGLALENPYFCQTCLPVNSIDP